MGGVLTTSPFEKFTAYERRAGLPRGFIRLVNSTNPDRNAWARLERGELGRDEFKAAFEIEAEAFGQDLDGAEVLDCLDVDLRLEMVSVVERCRARLKTAMLTNNFVAGDGTAHLDDARAAVHGLFDVVVESSKVGLRKPDPRFYRLACDQLGVEPAACVFLDDLGINLKPAKAMGMTTIKVVDPVVAVDELEAAVGFALR